MTELQMENLTAQYDSPLYVFDVHALRQRVAFLRRSLPTGVGLCYAIKANPFLLRELCGIVERFEVCSPGEAAICRRLHIPAEEQVISGVYKTPSDIERMIAQKNGPRLFTVESIRQFALLSQLAARYRVTIHVLLRLTSGSQFGLEEDEIIQIIRSRADHPFVLIRGLQYFSGTQKASLKRLQRELDALDDFACLLAEKLGFIVHELEFGPGFPVQYFSPESFDEAEFLAGFSDMLMNLRCKAHVTLELGRSIAASCGTYLTRVVDVKHNKGQNYAILDGGIHHLVYYGQRMAMQLPPHKLYPPRLGEAQPWNLCGSLCTVNDILVKQLPVADLKCGDLFAFLNTGAYCMTEGISLFLSRALPRIVLLMPDGRSLLVRDALPTDEINSPAYERTEHYGTTACYSGGTSTRRGLRHLPDADRFALSGFADHSCVGRRVGRSV